MNSRHHHTPLTDAQRKRCPICDKAVYSLAGIHPQCAIKQNEGVAPALNQNEELSPATNVIVEAGPAVPPIPIRATVHHAAKRAAGVTGGRRS